MSVSDKPTLLVVDDEPDILFSLKALLRRDFDVVTAESGSEALETIARQPPHILMTDQRMPGMTGAELLIEAQRVSPETVPIMFTGYADIKAVIDAVNHGHIFRYLTKPWDPDDLFGVLSEAAAHYQRRAQRKRLMADMRQYLTQAVGKPNGSHADTPSPKNGHTLDKQAQELLDRLNGLASAPPNGD